MTIKEIKIKLELTSINIYAGGAEQLLDDIKNAGIVIHNDSNGYYITSESETKYSASTDYAEKLNQLKILTVLSPEETEIAILNIAFINKDNDNPYAVPDNATINGETINLTFNSYTLTFTNTEYPQFDIELPEAMIVPEGTSVVLPSVSGSFEDEEYTYTPSAWSIGNFGESVVVNEDTVVELVWNKQALVEEHTGYVGQLHDNNYYIQSGFFVKDVNNNTILYDENKIYTFVALYMASGQEPDNYTKANCSIIGNPESQGNPKKVYAVIDHTGYQTIGCYCIYTTQNV